LNERSTGVDHVTHGNATTPKAVTLSDRAASIYAAYPKKVGRAAAIKAIGLAIKAGVDPARLHERTKAYAAAVAKWPAEDRAYIPNPATWYNQGRWDDDPAAWVRTANNSTGPKAPMNGSDYLVTNG